MLNEWKGTKSSVFGKLKGFLSSKAFSERFAEVAAQLKDALGVLADIAALRTAVEVAQRKWPVAEAQLEAIAAEYPDRFKVWYTLDRPGPGNNSSNAWLAFHLSKSAR